MSKTKKKNRRESLRKRTKETADNRPDSSGKGVLNTSDYEEVNFFKPSKGRNTIDIIPFQVSEDWYPKLRSPKGQPILVETGDLDYKLEVPIHFGIGPEEQSFVCLQLAFGEPCPVCEERKAMDDDEIKKALKPKWRNIYNVNDHGDEEKGTQIFDVSEYLFERELIEEATQSEDGIVTFSDPDEGSSISFRAKEVKKGGYTFTEFKSFVFEERDPIDDETIDNAFPLDSMLKIVDYKTLQNIFLGISSDDEEEPETGDDEPETTEDFLEGLGDDEIAECPDCERPIPADALECPYDDCDTTFETSDDDAGQEPEEEEWDGKSCPQDLAFGKECSSQKVCEDCSQYIFEVCSEELDRLNAEEEKKAKAKKKVPAKKKVVVKKKTVKAKTPIKKVKATTPKRTRKK